MDKLVLVQLGLVIMGKQISITVGGEGQTTLSIKPGIFASCLWDFLTHRNSEDQSRVQDAKNGSGFQQCSTTCAVIL